MKLINLYKSILFSRKVEENVWNIKLQKAFLLLLINVGFHVLFSLQVYVEGLYPFLKLLNISKSYYYLIQAIVLFPVSIYVYFMMSVVIYLMTCLNTTHKYEEILKICICTVSIPIGVIFAIPCILLYLFIGYKMAIFVPIFSTIAFVFAFAKLFIYLKLFLKKKVLFLIILLAMMVAFIPEFLIVR